MTKPSRSLLNGRDADGGGSFRVDSADSSENRIRLSGLTEASVPTTSAASHLAPADRLHPELNGGPAGGAGGRGGYRRPLGAEPFRQVLSHRAEQEAFGIRLELPPPSAARSRSV